jgi:hypothetical protein
MLSTPADRAGRLLALATGAAAAAMHFAGALKSTPAGARAPVDPTLAAALLLAPGLVLLGATRRWWLARPLGLPFAGCALLWLWLVIAGAWSASGAVLAAKLPEATLMGPAMLVAGLMVGGEAVARRGFVLGTLAIGLGVGAAVAWGLSTGNVVLGGTPGMHPDLVRVQYQLTGLVLASAAGLAALGAVERTGSARLVRLGLLAALGGVALLPGGRAALFGLVATVALAPAILLWRSGRPLVAVAWPAALVLAGMAGLAALLADPALAAGLRTLERLVEGDPGESSGRYALWSAALDWTGATGGLGLGTGGFTLAAGYGERRGLYPHSHPLEALVEGGAPAFLFWLLAFGGGLLVALRRGMRVAPLRSAEIAALTLPVAITVLVSTDLGNRMAWFALGLALSLGVEAALPRPARV